MYELPQNTILKGESHQYKIVKKLGQGGFGITYLATVKMVGSLGSIDTEVKVAVKEFFIDEINGRGRDGMTVTSGSKGGIFDNYKKKFQREALSLSKLQHPNIIKVIEAFEANNTVYYVMEFISGGSLNDYIEEKGRLSVGETIRIAKQVGEALSFMHEKRMLHLDIKPGNIMMREKSEPILIDFGLSKQYDKKGNPETSTTVGGGTPGYAPLEQLHHKDGKGFPMTMDVYALGATLFKMLTGDRPPEASDIFNDEYPSFPYDELSGCNVTDSFAACIDKAMSPKKKDRYQTVKELVAALEREMVEDEDDLEVVTLDDQWEEEDEIEVVLLDRQDKEEKYDSGDKSSLTASQMNELGDDYYFGRNGKDKDYAEAVKWYRKAAEQGNASGQFNLGWMYRKGFGVAQNNTEAVKWYRKAAEQGDASGQYNLGYMYENGYGVSQDYAKAVKWYRKAAEQGDASGQFNLGWMYRKGLGVAQNYSEAVKWYRKAAEQGDADAQNNLGEMYYYGRGVTQNHSEAVKWYRKAAEQGNVGAQYSLGWMYSKGYGVTQNYTEAVKWYRKAAEQGYAIAQYYLGTMYYYGHGVQKNLSTAKYWYEKAAAQGHEKAIKQLKALKGN